MKSVDGIKTAVSIGLPNDQEARAVIGPAYDPTNVLNVIKMFAGTEDMYPAAVGFIRSLFQAKGVDPKTREMVYVNAGHNDPILRRASGQIERLPTGGPPFGLPLFTDEPVPYPSGRVQLHPGDLLFIFTDGVVEAVNDAGEEYGEARLLPCVQNVAPETSDETLKRVMADVNAFVGYARQHDDITCLVLRVSA